MLDVVSRVFTVKQRIFGAGMRRTSATGERLAPDSEVEAEGGEIGEQSHQKCQVYFVHDLTFACVLPKHRVP